MASIYKQKRSRFWWIKYRDLDGRLIRTSLGTPSRSVALECKFQLESRLRRGARPAEFTDAISDFLASVRSAGVPHKDP